MLHIFFQVIISISICIMERSRYQNVLTFHTDSHTGKLINTQCRVCSNSRPFKAKGGYRHANNFHADLVIPVQPRQGRKRKAARHGAHLDAEEAGACSTAAAAAAAAAAETPTAAAAATGGGVLPESTAAASGAHIQSGTAAVDVPMASQMEADNLLDMDVSDAGDSTTDSSDLETDSSSKEPELLDAYDADAFRLDTPEVPFDDESCGWDSADLHTDSATAPGSSGSSSSTRPAGEGTTEWYRQHLDEPLYPQPPGNQTGW
jgi:hypothetical protein